MEEEDVPPLPEGYTAIVGNYYIGKTIGRGTFGNVKAGLHIPTNLPVAIKILDKEKIMDESDRMRVTREIQILRSVRHPNIIQLFEIIESTKQLFLITDYAANSELFGYIVQRGRLQENEVARLLVQILSAVDYLHKNGIAHRDLKPENLLLDANSQIKVADFGLSNTYQDGDFLKTACGSPCYAAPEMVAGKMYDGYKTDIWSAGVVAFAMLCGFLPFEDPSTAVLYKKIINDDFEIADHLSESARDLLQGMLMKNPNERFNIQEIFSHKFIVSHVGETSRSNLLQSSFVLNQQVIKAMHERFQIPAHLATEMVNNNRHNPITATYYLLENEFPKQKSIEIEEKPVSPLKKKISIKMFSGGQVSVVSAVSPTAAVTAVRQNSKPEEEIGLENKKSVEMIESADREKEKKKERISYSKVLEAFKNGALLPKKREFLMRQPVAHSPIMYSQTNWRNVLPNPKPNFFAVNSSQNNIEVPAIQSTTQSEATIQRKSDSTITAEPKFLPIHSNALSRQIDLTSLRKRLGQMNKHPPPTINTPTSTFYSRTLKTDPGESAPPKQQQQQQQQSQQINASMTQQDCLSFSPSLSPQKSNASYSFSRRQLMKSRGQPASPQISNPGSTFQRISSQARQSQDNPVWLSAIHEKLQPQSPQLSQLNSFKSQEDFDKPAPTNKNNFQNFLKEPRHSRKPSPLNLISMSPNINNNSNSNSNPPMQTMPRSTSNLGNEHPSNISAFREQISPTQLGGNLRIILSNNLQQPHPAKDVRQKLSRHSISNAMFTRHPVATKRNQSLLSNSLLNGSLNMKEFA